MKARPLNHHEVLRTLEVRALCFLDQTGYVVRLHPYLAILKVLFVRLRVRALQIQILNLVLALLHLLTQFVSQGAQILLENFVSDELLHLVSLLGV